MEFKYKLSGSIERHSVNFEIAASLLPALKSLVASSFNFSDFFIFLRTSFAGWFSGSCYKIDLTIFSPWLSFPLYQSTLPLQRRMSGLLDKNLFDRSDSV